MKLKHICVYCSSSEAVDRTYFELAEAFGAELAQKHYTLVFGGTDIGLMGRVAHAAHNHGGKVIGVIPEGARNTPYVFHKGEELIFTKDLRERKGIMDARSDAFVALPGGFGTLDEIVEVLTLKQIQFHNKPIVFLNYNGFYDGLTRFFDHLYQTGFASRDHHSQLYYLASNTSTVFEYLARYQPPEFPVKWF